MMLCTYDSKGYVTISALLTFLDQFSDCSKNMRNLTDDAMTFLQRIICFRSMGREFHSEEK